MTNSEGRRRPPIQLLVVDDDRAIRRLLRRTFTAEGYVVFEASDGETALAMCARRRCDIVISDIVMPWAEGLDFILQLRRRYRHMKIVAISGGGTGLAQEYLDAASSFGADRVLAKPFAAPDIVNVVADLMAER